MTETMQPKKIAVVLFNLGGPTGPKTIYPFLYNFFMDPNIIPWLKPLRFLLAHFIATLRSNGPAKAAYGEMGGASPLLENTLAQAKALKTALASPVLPSAHEGTRHLNAGIPPSGSGLQNDEMVAPEIGAQVAQSAVAPDIRVYVCMRYWHPLAESVVPQVQAFNPDQLMLVSLYPQMSSTTFWSSLTSWQYWADKFGFTTKPAVLCCYPTEPGFIAASVKNIQAEIDNCRSATGRLPRLLFSAHSLPNAVIEKGDPYEWQCRQTAQAILKQLDIPDLDWRISYQSKVGPQKWLGPQTIDEIRQAGAEKIPLIVYPHAFVSEHVETIVELGIEYRHVAESAGVPYYGVVPTVGTHPDFITGLAAQIKKRLGCPGIYSHAPDGGIICPPEFKWCCQRRAKSENIFDVTDIQAKEIA